MTFIAFDIEATIDPAMPPYESKDERPFPPAPWWTVEIIGALSADDDMRVRSFWSWGINDTEAESVSCFVLWIDANTQDRLTLMPDLLTFNGNSFDLPVLIAACMRHGIPFPYRFSRDVTYRYTIDGHHDLLDTLSDYGASKRATLDAWAKLVGFPGKVGVFGDDVTGLIAAGKRNDVERYCLCDVAQLYAIALRDRLVRGRLSAPAYRCAALSLLDAIDEDARLCDIADKIDRDFFLRTVGS